MPGAGVALGGARATGCKTQYEGSRVSDFSGSSSKSSKGGAGVSLLAACICGALLLGIPGSALAGYKMEFDDDRWISLGVGLRFEAGAQQESGGREWDKNFTVDSIRPYIGGQVHEYIKFEANLDYTSSDNSVELLDGIIKFEFNDQINFWGGRFLPPTDRANFSGPYFLNTWAFPLVSQRYPQIYAGRDNGVAFWGYDPSGRLKYQVGVFEGASSAHGPSYDARLTLNLLDKETGYYNASTYFGEKNILAIGAVINAQRNGAGADYLGEEHNFVGWNVDLLFETKMGAAGALTVDASYFSYSNDGFVEGNTGSPTPLTSASDVTASRADGDGFYVTLGWYLPGEYGFGSMKGLVQPHVRYQGYDNEQDFVTSGPNAYLGAEPHGYQDRWDVGINWYLRGQDAKVVLYYYHQDDNADLDSETAGRQSESGHNGVHLGVQLQF